MLERRMVRYKYRRSAEPALTCRRTAGGAFVQISYQLPDTPFADEAVSGQEALDRRKQMERDALNVIVKEIVRRDCDSSIDASSN